MPLSCMCALSAGLAFVGLILLYIIVEILYKRYKYKILSNADLKNKHVIITGGSSGIGKSLACEAARRGAHVTIVARDSHRLTLASQEISQACVSSFQRVLSLSLDVTDNFEEVEKAFNELEQEVGPIFMLINCAGSAVCGKLEETSVSDIRKMFEVNWLGTVFPTKAVIENMKTRGYGHVVFTASQAAFLGIYGYSAYSSSKFALRGFAESLYMEVVNYGVKVTISFPPDTDTPGFAEEEKNKPQETRLISQSSGLWSPKVVADKIMKDALAGHFTSTVGVDGFLLSTLCAGMTPYQSISQLIIESFLMGFFRLVGAVYLISFNRIIKKCMLAKNKSKKAE